RLLPVLGAHEILGIRNIARAHPVFELAAYTRSTAAHLLQIRADLGVIQIDAVGLLADGSRRFARIRDQRLVEGVAIPLIEACRDRAAAILGRLDRDIDLEDAAI